MAGEPFLIQLMWQDIDTGNWMEPVLALPVALGRDGSAMPKKWQDHPVTQVVLTNKKVSRFHALITWEGNQILLKDHSANGTVLQDHLLRQGTLPVQAHDRIEIGPYHLTLTLVSQYDPQATEPETHHQVQLAPQWWSQGWAIALFGTVLAVSLALGTGLVVTRLLEKARPSRPSFLEMRRAG